MNPTKRLSGVCSECGGSLQFPAELVGTMATCPRCRKQTELMLAAPPEEPWVPRKVILWTAITVAILILGLIGLVFGLKHYENRLSRQRNTSTESNGAKEAETAADFEVSAISLEKGSGSDGTYAVGTVVNTSPRRRSGVTLEIDLLDAEGKKVGIARALRPVLEPGAKWQVNVPVTGNSKAVSAKLASITSAS